MTFSEWWLYCLLATTIVYAPGPMTLFAMAHGVQSNYGRTFFAIIGGSTAYVVQMLIVALGLGLLIQESEVLLKTVKILGASYLFYMAYKQWKTHSIKIPKEQFHENEPLWSLYIRGFLVGLSNPKALLLFAVIFPQFINPKTEETSQFVLLGVTFLVIQFVGASTYASVGNKVFAWLQAKNLEKIQGKLFACILVMVGLFLLR